MAGPPCSICTSTQKMRLSAELIAAGMSDQKIAERLGVGRMSVARHRHNHVVKPAKAIAEAANKGRDVAQQRAELMAAAEAGDPAAFVALTAIVADMRKVTERLERTAAAAEQDNQRLAVSALSSQQLRAAEVRAKIGGVGSYAPARSAEAAGTGQAFAINIVFSNGERLQVAAAPPADRGAIVEGDVTDVEDGPPAA